MEVYNSFTTELTQEAKIAIPRSKQVVYIHCTYIEADELCITLHDLQLRGGQCSSEKRFTVLAHNVEGGDTKMASPSQSPQAFSVSPGASPRSRAAQREEGKCTVCLEPHTEPRVLPCLHIFCTRCLQLLLDEILGGNLVCPNCRAETDPPLNAEDFPLDHAAVEQRSFCEAAEEKEGPCKNCEGDDTVAYCGECDGGICEVCVKLHDTKMKAFRDHKYVSWKDISESSFKLHRPKRVCKIHDLGIQLYCEKCCRFICSLCLKESHVTHAESTKPLLEVREKRLGEVGRMSGTAEGQLCVLESRLENLRQMEVGLADYPKSLEMSITRTFEEYMRQLTVWCQQIVTEAKEKCCETAKSLSSQQTDVENAMVKLKTGVQFAKRAASCTNDDEIIEMCGLAIHQLQGTMQGCEVSPLKRPLVFEKGELKLGKLREIDDGDVIVEPPNFSFMHIENPIKVKFTLPIHTNPEVKILYGSQKQRSVTLHPTTPVVDSCTVNFFPRCSGRHSIEVWVGGAMCRRCDNVMVVRGAPENASPVRPGPDWKGDGKVTSGTVMASEQVTIPQQRAARLLDFEDEPDGEEQESFKVKVQWNSGEMIDYDWGNNDEYELELDLHH